MDPVSQIFAQAKLGSAQGQSFSDSFERGMSFASRRREFEREMSMKERAFQAQEQSVLLENKLNQIKVDEFNRTIRDREASLGAYKELSDLVESNVRAGKAADPKVSFQIFGILAKNPALAESPRAQALLKTFNDSVQLTLKQKEIENQASELGGIAKPVFAEDGKTILGYERPGASGPRFIQKPDGETSFTPETRTLNDPITGKPITLIRVAPNQWREPRGEGEEISFTSPSGEVLTVKRGGGGKAQDGLTVANKTKLQDSLSQSLVSIDVANRLEPLISSETVGPRAFVEGIALDKVLSNVYPDLASKERAEAKVLIARMRSSAIGELKSDGNITEKERAQILQAVPGVNDPLDSPQNSRNVIAASRKLSALRALTISQKLGEAIPVAAVRILTLPDIVQAKKSGLINEATALQAFDLLTQQP